MPIIYQLDWNISHKSPDLSHDAKIVPFFKWEESVVLSAVTPYVFPSSIEFDAFFFHLIGKLDYPFNNLNWPIMSKRMLQVLLDVGNFAHRVIPLTMINCEGKVTPDKKITHSGEKNYDFVAVQLLEHHNFFNAENSIYTPHPRLPQRAKKIEKLAVALPDLLPPLFRLSVYPPALFLSEDAKESLETAGITGVEFIHLNEFKT